MVVDETTEDSTESDAENTQTETSPLNVDGDANTDGNADGFSDSKEQKPQEQSIQKSPLEDDEDSVSDKSKEDTSTNKEVTDDEWIKSAGLDAEGLETIPCGKNSYGEDVCVTAEEQRKLAPYLRKAGIPAESAKSVYGVLAKIISEKTEADNELYRKHISQMAEEQKAFFGDDFPKYVKEAKAGLRKIFPGEYGRILSQVPELGYSKDFLSGMAKIGRMFTNDDGTGGSASAEMANEAWNMKRWLAHDSK